MVGPILHCFRSPCTVYLSALAENFQLYNLFFNMLKICVLNSYVPKSLPGYSVHVYIELKMQTTNENLHIFCLIGMYLILLGL